MANNVQHYNYDYSIFKKHYARIHYILRRSAAIIFVLSMITYAALSFSQSIVFYDNIGNLKLISNIVSALCGYYFILSLREISNKLHYADSFDCFIYNERLLIEYINLEENVIYTYLIDSVDSVKISNSQIYVIGKIKVCQNIMENGSVVTNNAIDNQITLPRIFDTYIEQKIMKGCERK